MDLSSLIGGLGLGSVATLFLKEYFENRRAISRRAFEEKREAYVNYLKSLLVRKQCLLKKPYGRERQLSSASIYVETQRWFGFWI